MGKIFKKQFSSSHIFFLFTSYKLLEANEGSYENVTCLCLLPLCNWHYF